MNQDSVFDSGLPANPEIEKLVLGAILNDHVSVWPMVEYLTLESFSLHSHQRIFAAIVELVKRKETVDSHTIAQELMTLRQLESVGGLAYLIRLDDGMPEVLNLDSYTRILSNLSMCRKVIVMANNCALRLIAEPDAETLAIELAKFQNIEQIYEQGDDELAFLGDIIADEGGIQGLMSAGVPPLPTPLPLLNNVMAGGLRRGQMVIVAGRPSDGKTAFALQTAKHISQNGGKVAFFSLETSRKALVLRLLADTSGVSLQSIRRANGGISQLDSEERRDLAAAAAVLSGIPLAINKNQRCSAGMIHRQCERFKKKNGLDAVVVDFIQLMEGSIRSQQKRYEVIGDISRSMKLMGPELDLVTIMLAQLKRSENTTPVLSDLRESGNLEQDADVVIAPHRPRIGAGEAQRHEMHLLKQKDGPTGAFSVEFDAKLMRFYNLQYKTGDGN